VGDAGAVQHHVAATIDELLDGAEGREPFVNPDGRSTSAFERVWIDGRPHILKHVHLDDDFTMRVSGDLRSRTVRAWAAGHLDAAPELVDHAIVGASMGHGRNGWGAALLMRDISDELLPPGDATLDPTAHARFLDHVAGFSAATWGWRDDDEAPVLQPYRARWMMFGRAALDGERGLGWPERVPANADEGWGRFEQRAPADLAKLIGDLRTDVAPLCDALRRTTPSCFLHGDVKASNTGVGGDGRTVLIDWAYVGEGPTCHELCWHLALDRQKLPRSKEDTIAAYRAALEGHGIDTEPWWDRQLDLCLLGALVQFGWEKAFGDDDELSWWIEAARPGLLAL
jgi:hypothetical protein